MPEELVLTVPVQRTGLKLRRLTLDWGAQNIQIVVQGSEGAEVAFQYSGTDAVALMTVLNTANLTSNSLHKRVLNKLVADGHVTAGTVTGTPS